MPTPSSLKLNRRIVRAASVAAAAVVGIAGLTACGANDAQSGGEDAGPVIALLLPESNTTRYETFDRPFFEAKVAELCEDCTVEYYNADQDESQQDEQVNSAVGAGADVVVLDPVNGDGAGGMVQTVQDSGAEVIAYDRFIAGADYYMSFDNFTVGELQAQALVDATGDKGDILMLNGAPSDPNAGQFKEGAHSVIDDSGLNVLAEYDNPDWSPENAQQWVTDQLARYDLSQIAGVYAANDGQAGGVISALTGAGMDAASLPPVTGQDSELEAIQRIVRGEQAMTIYKSIKLEAETAAEVAVQLATDENVEAPDEFEGVPSFIFDPVVVTPDNVADTVVADEFHSVEDICAGNMAEACAEIGLE